MVEIFEVLMLICFGLSWPVSVVKSVKTRSTNGKSVIFIVAVIIGYISGIAGKIIGGKLNYVFVIYCINLLVVGADLIVYFINRKNEKLNMQKA